MFVTQDLDQQERLKTKELREELWRSRKDGEENVFIHKGKIVDKKKPNLKHFIQRRPRSTLGFKIDYWAARVVEMKTEILIFKQIREEERRKNKCNIIDKMSCLYLNARSVINKLDELELDII